MPFGSPLSVFNAAILENECDGRHTFQYYILHPPIQCSTHQSSRPSKLFESVQQDLDLTNVKYEIIERRFASPVPDLFI